MALACPRASAVRIRWSADAARRRRSTDGDRPETWRGRDRARSTRRVRTHLERGSLGSRGSAQPVQGPAAVPRGRRGRLLRAERAHRPLASRLREAEPGLGSSRSSGRAGAGSRPSVRAGLVARIRRDPVDEGGDPTSRSSSPAAIRSTSSRPRCCGSRSARHPVFAMCSSAGSRGLLEAVDQIVPRWKRGPPVRGSARGALHARAGRARTRAVPRDPPGGRGRSRQPGTGGRDAPRRLLRSSALVPAVRRAPGGEDGGDPAAHPGRARAGDPWPRRAGRGPARSGPRGRHHRRRRPRTGGPAAHAVRADGAVRTPRGQPLEPGDVSRDRWGRGRPLGAGGAPVRGERRRRPAGRAAGLPPARHAGRGTVGHASEGETLGVRRLGGRRRGDRARCSTRSVATGSSRSTATRPPGSRPSRSRTRRSSPRGAGWPGGSTRRATISGRSADSRCRRPSGAHPITTPASCCMARVSSRSRPGRARPTWRSARKHAVT